LSLEPAEEISALQAWNADQGLQLCKMQEEGKELEKEGEEQAASRMVEVESSIQDAARATYIL
jgi:hypothetical protein